MKKTGIELIAEERREQIEKHGYTLEHDKKVNSEGELVNIAVSLIEGDTVESTPFDWDEDVWRKMVRKPQLERLAIAGALIAAEIDRIQSISK